MNKSEERLRKLLLLYANLQLSLELFEELPSGFFKQSIKRKVNMLVKELDIEIPKVLDMLYDTDEGVYVQLQNGISKVLGTLEMSPIEEICAIGAKE